MKVQGFARVVRQLFDQSVKLIGQVLFGSVVRWIQALGRTGLPPFIGLSLEAAMHPPPIGVDMMGNAVDPGRKAGSALVTSQTAPNLAEGFLGQVRSISLIATETAEVAEESFVMAGQQIRSSVHVALASQPTEFFILIQHNASLYN